VRARQGACRGRERLSVCVKRLHGEVVVSVSFIVSGSNIDLDRIAYSQIVQSLIHSLDIELLEAFGEESLLKK
jgi:hypothetical protein